MPRTHEPDRKRRRASMRPLTTPPPSRASPPSPASSARGAAPLSLGRSSPPPHCCCVALRRQYVLAHQAGPSIIISSSSSIPLALSSFFWPLLGRDVCVPGALLLLQLLPIFLRFRYHRCCRAGLGSRREGQRHPRNGVPKAAQAPVRVWNRRLRCCVSGAARCPLVLRLLNRPHRCEMLRVHFARGLAAAAGRALLVEAAAESVAERLLLLLLLSSERRPLEPRLDGGALAGEEASGSLGGEGAKWGKRRVRE